MRMFQKFIILKHPHNDLIMRFLSFKFPFALLTILMLMLGGCRSKRNISFPGGSTGRTEIIVNLPENLSLNRKRIIEEAHKWLGTPYKYGCSQRGVASDCSGMVVCVFEESIGAKLPRNSAQQSRYCKSIKLRDVLPGDLVFFATGKDPDRISHVGIMLDGDAFIHVSTSKGTCISSVNSPYYRRTFKAFGRPSELK